MNRSRVTLLNMMSALILQIFTIISGFVVPRIVLAYFGSDVNGLIASLTQFINYIALIEGGITSVVTANLYKPLVNKDNSAISSVLVTAKKFYHKIGLIFVIYALALSVIYPLVVKTEFSYAYVFSLSMILSVGVFIQYMFSLTLKTLLDADKKSYIISITQTIIIALNILFALISAKLFPRIHFMKIITSYLFILQPVVYGRYVKKNYSINWHTSPHDELLKERWDGFAINTAAFIHNSTDVTVLTIFTDLKTVSIYSVYALVTNGLKLLLNSLFASVNPVIGQAYAKENKKELNLKLDVYEYLVFILVFFSFTISAMLITPFVLLYTKGVNDANYNQAIFGILLSISEAVYLIKTPHLGLAYAANQFKRISIPAYIEAIINIVITVILVHFIGLIGVAIGTIAGMIYRMIFHVYFTTTLVKGRKQNIFYRKLLCFVIVTMVGVALCQWIPVDNATVSGWILSAFIYSVILFVIYSILTIIMFQKELRYILNYVGKR